MVCGGGGRGRRGEGSGEGGVLSMVELENEQFPLGLSLQMVPPTPRFPIFYIQKPLLWYRSQQNTLTCHSGNKRGQKNHWEILPELQTQGLPSGDTSSDSLIWIRARSSKQSQGPLASPTPVKGNFL